VPGGVAGRWWLPSAGMPRDLLRPRAIVRHVLVLTVATACVALGLWQLDRLETLRTSNARAEARLGGADRRPGRAGGSGERGDRRPGALEFRRVEVTGTYRPDEEVLQRGQQHPRSGQAGFHVLTPFELVDGGVVLVRRGWVPSELSEPPVAQASPPTGEVTVRGVLERPVGQPGFGPQDPDEGELVRVFHADTARLDRQVDGTLFPMVLRLDAEAAAEAAPTDLPVPAGPPVLDERNHLSYALQWFSFAALALVTYGAWLWSRGRRGRPEGGATDDETRSPDRPVASSSAVTPPRSRWPRTRR
jgi:surfeit locus 1 family protein